MNDNGQRRQGDVFLERVADIPADVWAVCKIVPRDDKRVVLAYGEVTGHAHAISDERAELYESLKDGSRWLIIRKVETWQTEEGTTAVELRHEEHAPIMLEPGVYKVVRQREYTPSTPRWVAD